jgi:gluconate 5-dehydrogenase
MTKHVRDLFDLTGRVAIVTGGSRGLGKEMAEGLAEAGAALMICARRDEWLTPTVNEFRERGFKCEGMLCDVANAEQVQQVIEKTIESYGRIDILINNAGVSWGERPETMPVEKWAKVIDINLTGAFLFAQAAGREMLKRGYGRIINVASVSGIKSSAVLCRLRSKQSGTFWTDEGTGSIMGTRGHQSECHCARFLSLAAR